MVGKLLLYYQNRFVLMNCCSINKDEDKTEGVIYMIGLHCEKICEAKLNGQNRE